MSLNETFDPNREMARFQPPDDRDEPIKEEEIAPDEDWRHDEPREDRNE